MALWGQSRKLARLNGMSVPPSTADVIGPPRHVRFVPQPDSCAAANWTLVSRRNGCGRLPLARPRQYDLELSEKSGLRLDIYAAAVLLYDDVVTHRQAKPGTFARGLGREERIEHLFFHVGGDSGAVVANPDFDGLAEIFVAAIRTGSKVSPSSNLRWVAA